MLTAFKCHRYCEMYAVMSIETANSVDQTWTVLTGLHFLNKLKPTLMSGFQNQLFMIEVKTLSLSPPMK